MEGSAGIQGSAPARRGGESWESSLYPRRHGESGFHHLLTIPTPPHTDRRKGETCPFKPKGKLGGDFQKIK